MNKGEAICVWLNEHEQYFKVAVLAKAIGSNPGNFAKYRAEKRIPNKYIEAIELILYKYGYSGIDDATEIKPVAMGLDKITTYKGLKEPPKEFFGEVKKVAAMQDKDVIEAIKGKKVKPPRLPGENGYEYSIRMAEMGF